MAEVISEPSAFHHPRRDEISTVYVEWNPPPPSPGALKGHRGALSSIQNGQNPLDWHVTPRKTGVKHVYSRFNSCNIGQPGFLCGGMMLSRCEEERLRSHRKPNTKRWSGFGKTALVCLMVTPPAHASLRTTRRCSGAPVKEQRRRRGANPIGMSHDDD